jgi:hypothetical protein
MWSQLGKMAVWRLLGINVTPYLKHYLSKWLEASLKLQSTCLASTKP